MRSKPFVTGALGALALVLVPAAMAGNGGFAPPEPASPNAERINDTYYYIAVFTGVIFVLVEGALFWFVYKYRRGRRPGRRTARRCTATPGSRSRGRSCRC